MNPCVDFGDEIAQIKKYNEYLELILIENLHEDYMVRFIAKPSFDPEYIFQIRKMNCVNYEIEFVFFQENLWNARDYNSVMVAIRKCDVPKEIALKLYALFDVFIVDSLSHNVLGAIEDGDNFIFEHKNNDKVKCGEIWSPNKNTLLGELVHICNILIEYAIIGEERKLIEIQERINKLYGKAKSSRVD